MFNYITPAKENDLESQYNEYLQEVKILEESDIIQESSPIPLPSAEIIEGAMEVNLQKQVDGYNTYKSSDICIAVPPGVLRKVSHSKVCYGLPLDIGKEKYIGNKESIDLNIIPKNLAIASKLEDLNNAIRTLIINKSTIDTAIKPPSLGFAVWKPRQKVPGVLESCRMKFPGIAVGFKGDDKDRPRMSNYQAPKIVEDVTTKLRRDNLELANQIKVLMRTMAEKDEELDKLKKVVSTNTSSIMANNDTSMLSTSSFHMNVGNLMLGDIQTAAQLKKQNEELKAQIKKMHERNAVQKKAFQRELKRLIEIYENILQVERVIRTAKCQR
jgi:hypothetical protein